MQEDYLQIRKITTTFSPNRIGSLNSVKLLSGCWRTRFAKSLTSGRFGTADRGYLDDLNYWTPVDQHRTMAVISQEYADFVNAGRCRAMTEASFDDVTTGVAVHAVVRAAGNVATVAGRFDFHVNVTASRCLSTLARSAEQEIAANNDAHRSFSIATQGNDCAFRRPYDLEGRRVLRRDKGAHGNQ
jgi:hypothetical protein